MAHQFTAMKSGIVWDDEREKLHKKVATVTESMEKEWEREEKPGAEWVRAK